MRKFELHAIEMAQWAQVRFGESLGRQNGHDGGAAIQRRSRAHRFERQLERGRRNFGVEAHTRVVAALQQHRQERFLRQVDRLRRVLRAILDPAADGEPFEEAEAGAFAAASPRRGHAVADRDGARRAQWQWQRLALACCACERGAKHRFVDVRIAIVPRGAARDRRVAVDADRVDLHCAGQQAVATTLHADASFARGELSEQVRARATLVQQHKIGAIAVEAVVDRGRDAAKARLGTAQRALRPSLPKSAQFDLGKLSERNPREARVGRIEASWLGPRARVALRTPELTFGVVEAQRLRAMATAVQFAQQAI